MDIKTLLQSLLDHRVKFLVIGAWALPAYGYERMTRDVDIFFEPTKENGKRLMQALAEVGYDGIEDLPLSVFLKKKVLARGYLLQADTHPTVKGVTFATAWKTRMVTEIKGLDVSVPSLDNLMKMKRRAGRGKDLLDLEVLERIKKRQRTESNRRKSE